MIRATLAGPRSPQSTLWLSADENSPSRVPRILFFTGLEQKIPPASQSKPSARFYMQQPHNQPPIVLSLLLFSSLSSLLSLFSTYRAAAPRNNGGSILGWGATGKQAAPERPQDAGVPPGGRFFAGISRLGGATAGVALRTCVADPI